MIERAIYYGLLLPVAEGVAKGVALRDRKVRAALQGRRTPRRSSRGEETLDLWFHASSLGEFEQARPIIEALKARLPSVAAWVSFFSPSGLDHAQGYPHAEDLFYLPFRLSELQQTFDTIRPRALIVIRFDLWPGLAWEASNRGVPLLLVNATLHAGSQRNAALFRPLQRKYYQHIDRVLAATDRDEERLRKLCGPGVPVEVAGDSRYDRVWQRATAATSLGSLDSVLGAASKPLFVAGSTYEPEERVLADALAQLGDAASSMRVVVVPHEPVETRLRFVERLFGEAGWAPRRLSLLKPGEPWEMLVLDRVGVLAECYRHADFVMIGGSFKGKVHNVMEPAAWAKPIVVGPYYENSPEAVGMVASGGITVVEDAARMAAALSAWLADPGAAVRQGVLAREFLTSRLGASARIADIIVSTLRPASP